jgi:hypothetical protein
LKNLATRHFEEPARRRQAQRREPLALRAFLARKIPFFAGFSERISRFAPIGGFLGLMKVRRVHGELGAGWLFVTRSSCGIGWPATDTMRSHFL